MWEWQDSHYKILVVDGRVYRNASGYGLLVRNKQTDEAVTILDVTSMQQVNTELRRLNAHGYNLPQVKE